MFVARLICSDPDCPEQLEAEASSLEELERLLCDCGCAFEVIAWPDWVGEQAQVIAFGRARRTEPPLQTAA